MGKAKTGASKALTETCVSRPLVKGNEVEDWGGMAHRSPDSGNQDHTMTRRPKLKQKEERKRSKGTAGVVIVA